MVGLTTRQVADATARIVAMTGNQHHAVSHSWLSRLESGARPNLYALESLGRVYGVPPAEMLRMFGATADDPTPAVNTNGQRSTNRSNDEDIWRFLSELPISLSQRSTTMLLPSSISRRLDLRTDPGRGPYVYGYIGSEENTLYPLILASTVVQIDTSQRQVVRARWRSELERPIYFFERRHGYACGWCERAHHTLTVVAHPLSPAHSQTYPCPREIEIIGRVTALLMRLDPPALSAQAQPMDHAAHSRG